MSDSESEGEPGSDLVVAAQRGETEDVSQLFEQGVDPDAWKNKIGVTALWNAAWQGHADCVRLLTAARADANARTHDGSSTPLYMACQEGHSGCARLLLAAGAAVDAAVNESGLPPLRISAELGRVDCMELLLAAGARGNGLGDAGEVDTPLWFAAQGGHAACLALLLEAGAAVDRGSDCSPLAKACHMGHAEYARRLIRAGADVNHISLQGASPLLLATLITCSARAPGDPVASDFRGHPMHPLLVQMEADARQWPHEEKMDVLDALECVEALVVAGATTDPLDENVRRCFEVARPFAEPCASSDACVERG